MESMESGQSESLEQQKPETDRKQMPAVRLHQTKTAQGNA